MFLLLPLGWLWCIPGLCGQEEGAQDQWSLADHFFQTGEYYRAITEYKRFLFYFPTDIRADTGRMRIVEAYVRGQWWADGQRAAREFLDGGAVGEIRARFLFLLGVCEMRLGHLVEARGSFEEALQSSQDPELKGRAQYLIGETHATGAGWEDAARALEGVDARSSLGGQAARSAERIRERSPLPEKSPWTAGLLAAILPGAGHAYIDRWRDAGLVFSVNAAFTAATLEAIHRENRGLAGGMAMAELLWYSGNIFSAVGSAHKYNRAVSRQLLEELQLSPALTEPPPWRGEAWRGSP